MTERRVLVRSFSLAAALVVFALASVWAQTGVTLSTNAAPTAGQAGVHTITITGSGFPAGTIAPASVTVSVAPANGSAPAVETPALTIKSVVGSTRQVTFRVPDTILVTAPTAYAVRLRGQTSTGSAFASTNSVRLTLNPPAAIASITPAAVEPGGTATVTIVGTLTDFAQGSTVASFGPGIAVGTGQENGFGAVTVVNKTTAMAQVRVASGAPAGFRTVTVKTGIQEASIENIFTISRPNTAPVARPGGPYSATVGQAITFDGSASSDPDAGDSIASYQWNFGDGSAPATGATTSHTFQSAGTFTVTLTVTDTRGGSHSASVNAEVTPPVPVNRPPISVPGTGYVGDVGAPINFDGRASSDPDGDALTYAWNFGDGATGTGPTAQHAYQTAGEFVVTLTVSDGRGGTHSASTTATIAQPNRAPVANAGGPYSATVGVPLSLSAAASTDPDNDPLTYLWTFGDGQSGSGVAPQHTYSTAGQFTVTLTVTDGNGGSDSATATVSVVAANRAPVANAGGPYQVQVGTAVTFDGTGSSDPDNDPLTYAWTFGDGQSGTGATPQHTYQAPGQFTATLTVTDGRGGSATSQATVTVAPLEPDTTAPFVALTAPREALPGTQVRVIAQASDNVGVARVTFTVNGENPTDDASEPYERVVTIPLDAAAGTTFTVRAVATDLSGNTGAAQAVILVAAEPDTQDPTVALNAPAQASPGATIQLSATATDNVGVRSVTFFVGGAQVAADLEPPYVASYTVPAGATPGTSIQVFVRATDVSDRTADDTAQIEIVAAPDTTPPTVDLSAPAQVGAGRTLLLTAIAADNVGVASVQFFVNNVLVATDTDAPYEASYPVPANTAAGTTIELRARAVDFSGLQATAEGQTTVLANRAPTANIGGPYSAQVGDLIVFDATGSSDPDGDALSFAWAFGDNQTANGPKPSHAYATAGSFTATLTVSDGRGGNSTVETLVTVSAGADRAAPAVTLTAPAQVLPGTQVTVTADAVDNVGVTGVVFSVNGGAGTTVPAAPFTHVVTVPEVAAPGDTIAVRATATDAAGNTGSAQTTMAIVAAPDTVAPDVELVLPPNTAPGATVRFTAVVADSGGVQGVTFFVNGVEAGADATAPYEGSHVVPDTASGGSSLAISARAVDFAGNTGQASGSIPVLEQGDAEPPSITLTAPATIAAGATLQVSAQAQDNVGVASVTFYADGVAIGTDATAPFQATLQISAQRAPGTQINLQARAIDFAGLEATASAQSRVITAGIGAIAGEVYDAASGLPLAGAGVALSGTDALGRAYTQTATTDVSGRYMIRAAEGQGRLAISKTGYTSSFRAIAIRTGRAVAPIDARLTPHSPSTASIEPALGGTITRGGFEVAVPPGATTTEFQLTLTPVGQQGLQGLLPPGWSPMATLDLAPHGIAFAAPAVIRAPRSDRVVAGMPLVLAKWDAEAAAWRAVRSLVADQLSLSLDGMVMGTGQYAWLLADTQPAAPPVPAEDALIAGVEASLVPQDATTIVNPEPRVVFYQPGVRSDVGGQIRTVQPLPSGTLVRARVSESYRFFNGAQTQLDSYVADLVFFQAAGDTPAQAAFFPVTPSLVFEPNSLQQGVITVELRAPTGEDESTPILGSEGGSTSAPTGEQLNLPPGSIGDSVPVQIERLTGAQLGLTLPAGASFGGGATVSFSGTLNAPAVLSVPRPADLPAGSRLLLARVDLVKGESRLVLVGTGRVNGDRIESETVLAGAPIAFEGVRSSGRYLFVRVTTPFGFTTGTVLGTNSAALAGALVSSASLPAVVSLSASSGAYIAAVGTGQITVTAEDLQRADTGTGDATVPTAGNVVALNLTLVARPPQVIGVTPANNAVNVPLASSVVVRFSEPIDPATLTGANAQNIRLLKNNVVVPGALTLSGGNTVATFRPAQALDPNSTYTIAIAQAIKDLGGYTLAAAVTASFESLDTAAPTPDPAAVIRASIPGANGQTTVTGSNGTASAHDQVRVINKTRRTEMPAVVNADGSFEVVIAAGLTDKLEIRIRDAAGNETVVEVGRYENADGSVAIGPEGGVIEAAGGLKLTVAEGTFPQGSVVKFSPVAPSAITAQVGPDFPFVAAFEISSSARPLHYMNVSAPAPAGATATSTGIVAEIVNVWGQQALSIVDTAKMIDGRIATSSPPCPGITEKFGRYAIYMNEQEQMRLGISLLSMAVPRQRSVVLQGYSVNFPLFGGIPSIIHPPLNFTEIHNPVLPFINYIRETGDVEGGLENAQDPVRSGDLVCEAVTGICRENTATACMPVPPDHSLRVVVRDAQTGNVLQSVPQQTPPAGQSVPVTIYVSPTDREGPRVIWTSWSPRPPHTLDPGKAIRLQFSEAVTLGQVLGRDAVYLLNQNNADVIPVVVRFADGNRTLTLTPQRPLAMGVDFIVQMPGLTDFVGNPVQGTHTFRTFMPHMVSPFNSSSGVIALDKTKLLADLQARGFNVPSALNTVGLKDIDFITKTPQESPDGKWHTQLFGIGNARQAGFSILSLDAAQPTYPAAVGALPGGERFYTRLKVFPAFGLRPRNVQPQPPNPALTAWRQRELHYLANNPSERVCAAPGDPAIAAWRARQPVDAVFAMRSGGCGDLGLVTSYNVNYGILHLYDLTNPAAPVLMGQRLLNDGGAISGFPRKNEAPQGNGAPRGFGVITGVDITHQVGSRTAQHSDTNAAYVANQGVGMAMVDLDWNAPDIWDGDRPPQGQLIESIGSYSFPFYNDATIINSNVVSVAADRTDGTRTAHLEVFDPSLAPIGPPLPLPVVPYAMTALENVRIDVDGDGTPERHDFAVVTGQTDVAIVEIKTGGVAELVGYVKAPTSPQASEGLEITSVEGACPARTVVAGNVTVRSDVATRYRRGSCGDLAVGRKITVQTALTTNGTLRATDVTFIPAPEAVAVKALRYVDIDHASRTAYISADWTRDGGEFSGLLAIDLTNPYGGMVDQDDDGWDDRIKALIPIAGPGQPIRAADVNGVRFDQKRKLIYAALESFPKDGTETGFAILKACECTELAAQVVLTSGGVGAGQDRPSPDGESAVIYITPEMASSGSFRATFDIDVYQGTRVFYRITEVTFAEDGVGLLEMPTGEIRGELAPGSRQLTVPLRALNGFRPGSIVMIEFTDEDGNLLKRTLLHLVPTGISAPDIKVRTYVDRSSGEVYETPAYLNFTLNHDARVTIRVDGQVITPVPEGQISGAPFTDIPLPGGQSRVLITRQMVSVPGEHQFQIQARFEQDVVTVYEGVIDHEVVINETLPVGHSFVKGVDLADGHLALSRTDVDIPSVGPALRFGRTYSSAGSDTDSVMGAGWSHSLDSKLVIDGLGRISVVGGEGGGVRFTQAAGNDPTVRVFRPQAGYHGSLVFTGGAYDYYTKSRMRYHYELAPAGPTGTPEYRLAYMEDPAGNRLRLEYDAQRRLARAIDSAGRALTFTYAPHGNPAEDRITRVEGPLGLAVDYGYDAHGNLTSVTRAERTEMYAYTTDSPRDRHNMAMATDANGNRTRYTWFAAGDTFPGENPDFQWGREVIQIPLKHELVKQVTEGAETPDAATTTFAYDYSQLSTRYVTTVVDARGTESRYTMNPRGSVTEIRVNTEDGPQITTMRWAFEDGISDVYMTRKTEPNGRVTRFEYDENGNLEREIVDVSALTGYAPVTRADGTRVSEIVTEYEYHPRFNVPIRKTDPEGNVAIYDIDDQTGQVLSVTTDPGDGSGPIVVRSTYADAGQFKAMLRTTTNALNHVTTYRAYDEWGNATEVEDAEGNVTTNVFDARGRLLETRDTFGRRATFTYDALDRVDITTRFAGNQPPDAAMASADSVIDIDYFPNGEKRQVTDGLGHVTEFVYDALNRLRQQTERTVDADGSPVEIVTTTEYDGLGNARVETNGRGIGKRYMRDRLSRVRQEQIQDNGTWKTVSTLEYDAVGNVTAEIDRHGHRTEYVLDGLYRRVEVRLPIAPYTLRMAYDLVGNEVRVTDPNGNARTRTFDGVYRRRSETDPAGNTVTYQYDKAGNVTVETHSRTGLVRRIGPYDALGRALGTTVEFIDAASGERVSYSTSVEYQDDQHAVVITDPRGRAIREVLNGRDQVIARVADAGGLNLATLYRYDANGNEVAVKDAQGGEPDVVRVFDGLGRRIRSEYPLGGVERTFYDGTGNAVRTIDQRGIVMRHEFDAFGRKTADILVESISDAGQELVVATVSYDDAANTETRTDANGNPTVIEFDAMHREVRVTDASDQVQRLEWDGVNKRADVSKRGLRKEFTYDTVNRLTLVREFDEQGSLRTTLSTAYDDAAQRQTDTDRRGTQRIVQYDALGRTRRELRRHAELAGAYGAAEILLSETKYDGNNNVVETVDARGNVTRVTYDGVNRRETLTEGFGSPVAATTTFTYDNAGNVLTVKDGRASGAAADMTFTYDARSRKLTETNGESEVTTYTYDPEGRVLTMTEPKGGNHVTANTYDELGMLLAVDTTRGGEGGVTRFMYDANRNKVAQQDANGKLTTYAYDALNRLTDSFEHFAAGALADGRPRSAGAGGDQESALHWHHEYDADGNETLIVDAEGQRVTKAYDYLNREIRKEYANHREASDGSVIYPQIVSIATQYDDNGNPTRVEESKRLDATSVATEVTGMTYDRLNRLGSRTNADNKTVAYRYDRQGSRAAVVDADGVETTYTYDARNRVEMVTTQGSVTRYAYWPDSLARTTTYPNGSVSETTYDAADRPTRIVNHDGSAANPISQYDYQYDANGNREQQVERHRQLTGGVPQTTIYGYDALNRLATVTYPDGSTVAYTYAANGNRLTEIGVDPLSHEPVNREYRYNRRNQLLLVVNNANQQESLAFNYDRNGNTRSERTGVVGQDGQIANPLAVQTFDFDIRDQLAAVGTGAGAVRFDHDYSGLRTKKSGVFGNVRFVYDEASLLQEYEAASGVTLTKYNYGGDRLVSLVSSTGGASNTFYYLFDALGSTSELTNGNGAVQATYLYDVFGRVRQSADTTPNRRRFTGHYDDTETGLQYFGARYYDPSIGRFISQDPYMGNEQDPPSLHRYMYAHANPLLFVDPTGYAAERADGQFQVSYDGTFGSWAEGVAHGVLEGISAPIRGMVRSAVLGLADIAGAGAGMLAISATNGKYVDEIGELLQPESDMGKLAAEKGTLGAVKEAFSGFVKDTVTGVVTLPQRAINAARSGDPQEFGNIAVEIVQTGKDLKGPLAKVAAPVVRTAEQAVAAYQIGSHRRVSKRVIDGATREVIGTMNLLDAWKIAGMCVAKGTHGCAAVGGLQFSSVRNFKQNLMDTVAGKKTLAMGPLKHEVKPDGSRVPYKFSGDVDFSQYRTGEMFVNDRNLALKMNAKLTAPLFDPFAAHGILGEYIPGKILPKDVTAQWHRENRTWGQSVRAFDYWKRGVQLPGKPRQAYLLKPGTTGITERALETGWEYINAVHQLDRVNLWPGMDLVHLGWVQNASQDRREK